MKKRSRKFVHLTTAPALSKKKGNGRSPEKKPYPRMGLQPHTKARITYSFIFSTIFFKFF